ncbi:MAG: carotenoid 1,2-hydratase [bacterium]|nr:carotenoid 1,2-hydratase [bacterium]
MPTASGPPPLPARSGAYRWLYADVQAGPVTVVCIFMLGALFSPRYAVAARRGAAPLDHTAVNCAVYRDGRRVAWAFTEWEGAEAGPVHLRIGRSTWCWTDGGVAITVDERTAPWGTPLRLSLRLHPDTDAGPAIALDARRRHHWQAAMPRARARLTVPGLGLHADGLGYHDGNHGEEPLGGDLPGWTWARVHGARRTTIAYHLPAPAHTIVVDAGSDGVTDARTPPAEPPQRRTRWGLAVPQRLAVGDRVLVPAHLLESSPFYARLEARGAASGGIAEVADFRRFQQRRIRWMAYFRMRRERAA